MEADTTTCAGTAGTALTPRRYGRWLLLGLLLAALSVGWYYYPRTYRPVAQYESFGRQWLTCRHGFVIHEAPGVLALYDWRGRRQWRVHTLRPQAPAGKHLIDQESLYQYNYTFACDDAGRRLAVVLREPDGITVQAWRDGRLAYRTHFPGLMRNHGRQLQILQLNSGRVFIWSRDNGFSPTAVIADGKLLATGRLPQTFVLIEKGQYLIHPLNGGNDFRYARLRLRDGHLRTETCYVAKHRVNFEHNDESIVAATFTGGMVLADDGTLYGPRGRVAAASGWWHRSGIGRYDYVLQSKGREMRVWSPRTQRTVWQFHVKGEYFGGMPTHDGRHAIFYMAPDLNGTLSTLLRRLPWHPADTATLDLNVFTLYRRPGYLQAQARIDFEHWWQGPGHPGDEGQFAASPDGRSMVAAMWGTDAEGKAATRMVLLRY